MPFRGTPTMRLGSRTKANERDPSSPFITVKEIRILLIVLVSLSLALSANGYEHNISPDSQFEAYTTPRNPDGTGMRAFLRMATSKATGVLLRENDRWIQTSWAPDSRYLAVIDGSDGHVTDVFIYRVIRQSETSDTKAHYLTFKSLGEVADSVLAPGMLAQLWYHTPAPWTYDVQWDVAGWDISRNLVILTKRSRGSKDSRIRVALDSPQTGK